MGDNMKKIQKPKTEVRTLPTLNADGWTLTNTPLLTPEEFDLTPTPEQLAKIAAMLASDANQPPDALVKSAMKLWVEACIEIAAYNMNRAFEKQRLAILKSAQDTLQSITSVPVGEKALKYTPAENFVRQVLPQYSDRRHELMRIARDFLRHLLNRTLKRNPTIDELDKALTEWTPSKLLPDAKSEWVLGTPDERAQRYFKNWHKNKISEQRSIAGRKSAVKKRAKAKAAKASTIKSKY